MKSFSRTISLFLALMLLFGMLTIAPVTVSAAETEQQITAEENEGETKPIDEGDTTAATEDTTDSEATTAPSENQPEEGTGLPYCLSVQPIEIYEDLDASTVYSYVDNKEYRWSEYSYDNQIQFSLILDDGTVLESDEDGYVTYNGEKYTVEYQDDQAYNNEWTVGDHNVTFSMLGLGTESKVTVKESPIEKVEFKDVTCVEGTNGWATTVYRNNEETGKNEVFSYLYYYDDTPIYTVTLKDNTVIESSNGYFELLGRSFWASYPNVQYDNPWTAGTHDVTYTLFNKDYKIKYTITESDIKSISVEDVTVKDGIDSYYASYTVDDEEFTYLKYDYNPAVTITLKDGTTLNKHLEDGSIEVGDVTYRIVSSDDQDYGSEWTAGVHKAAVFAGHLFSQINVTVEEFPIKALTVSDTVVYYGIDCYQSYDFDAGEYWDEYYYTPEFTVTLADGSTVTGKGDSVTVDGTEYKVNFNDDQSYKTQWEVGKEYTVDASIGSLKTSFKISVSSDSVKSIKLLSGSITVQKGVDECDAKDSEGYYKKLSYDDKVQLEITMFDDTVVTREQNNDDYIFRGRELPVDFSDDQSRDNVWGVGTHTATAAVYGKSIEIKITVTDTPAESVTIEDVKIIKDTHKSSDFDEMYHYYPKYTVKLKDGTTLDSEEYNLVFYNGKFYSLDIEDDQSDENPWGLGHHKVTGSVLGVSAEFDVEIVESPVESVTADKLELIENASGRWTGKTQKYFHYDSSPMNYKVQLKDGSTLESDSEGCVYYQGEYYGVNDILDDQYADSPWTLGNTYSCKGKVLGFEFDYEATVIGSPVQSVTINDITLIQGYDDSIEYDDDDNAWNCYYYDYYEWSYKVTLKNGDVLESSNGSIYYNNTYYYLTNVSDGQSPENQWTAGNTYNISAYILGFKATINANVISNPVEEVNFDGPISVIEFDENYGYYSDYYENERYIGEYFYYDVTPDNYSVKFKDGTTVNSSENGFISYAGREFRIYYNWYHTVQDYYNQWTAGNTYTAYGSIIGFDTEYSVKIVSKESLTQPTETTAPPTTAPPVTSITLKAAKTKIYVGDTTTVKATVTNPVGTTKFKSSNTKIATVSTTGKVTAKAAGKVTITATNNGKSKSVTITIVKRTNTAKITTAKKTIKYSSLKKKAQTVKPITVKTPQGKVTYAKVSGDKKITVNKTTGKITLKKGMKKKTYTVKVKIKVTGTTKYNALTRTVTVKITVK